MHGVIFNDKHSWRDWGLLLKTRQKISPPTPKLKQIQVPGTDTVIDLTERLTGKVHYEPRTISFEFVTAAPREKWASLHSEILSYLHGKSVKIIFDDDPNWYYTGRVTVGDMEAEKKTANLTMTATVEPYKRDRFGGDGRSL
jgi:predicted phage tail component-like protein